MEKPSLCFSFANKKVLNIATVKTLTLNTQK